MFPLIYVLHNGNLYGMEQMALATLDGLRDEFEPYLFAPDGGVIKEALKMGISAQPYSSLTDLTIKLWLLVAAHRELGFIATDLAHSFSLIRLNFLYRRKITHLHMVSNGAEDSTYSKTGKLNNRDVTFVALSESVREKLIAQGTRHERIRVVENFLSEKRKTELPRRMPFTTNGVKKIAVISRLEPVKKVDLLLDALDFNPELSSLEFTIFGTGSQFETLRQRALKNNPNVHFAGGEQNITEKLVKADLLLHLCPAESSGLTILEALTADVPVLTADNGGIGSMISHNINGFSFRANDAENLARRLHELTEVSFDLLNAIAKGGRHLLNIRFSAENGVEKYRRLFTGQKAPTVDLARGKLIL